MSEVCVCVQENLRVCGNTKAKNSKSQEGGLCAETHKRFIRRVVNYTTTTTMHFASSSVDKETNLLALCKHSLEGGK